MKAVGITVLAVAAIVVLWLLGTALGIVGGVTERVADPDRMVGVYERFFDRCASVQALEQQRDAIADELEATDDTQRVTRLQSARQAVESQRARTISQYNADADSPTRSFLRSEGLPPRLDPTDETTECAL